MIDGRARLRRVASGALAASPPAGLINYKPPPSESLWPPIGGGRFVCFGQTLAASQPLAASAAGEAAAPLAATRALGARGNRGAHSGQLSGAKCDLPRRRRRRRRRRA